MIIRKGREREGEGAMGKGAKGHCDKRRKRQQMACVGCTVVLVILIIILAVLYFAVYRPKDPKLQVHTMQLVSMYPAGYTLAQQSSSAYLNLTLSLQVSIYNPNRATFIVQDGGVACLFYYGTQMGFTPLPTGTIPAQSFSTITVPVTVQGSAPLQGPSLLADISTGILKPSTTVTLLGRVTTLNLFSHHARVASKCDVQIALASSAIVSYTCHTFSIDP